MSVSLSYRSPKTTVKESAIQGRGLFAREAIPTGEIVAIKRGYIFDSATLRELEKSVGPAELPVADGFFIGPMAAEVAWRAKNAAGQGGRSRGQGRRG